MQRAQTIFSNILKLMVKMFIYGVADGIHGLLQYNKKHDFTKDGKRVNHYKDKSEWITTVSTRCKGIIESEDWLKTQNKLKTNKFLAPNGGKTNKAILTSKLKCKNCESTKSQR